MKRIAVTLLRHPWLAIGLQVTVLELLVVGVTVMAAGHDIVATARQAGISTTVVTSGETRPLPPSVDLAAYRIIQEALTNVLRHAGPASAEVRLSYEQDSVRLDVGDDGQGTAALSELQERSGHGIIGMRERAAAGGTLEAGPCPNGGFGVHAWLPLPEGTS